jgi:hypothetical protein
VSSDAEGRASNARQTRRIEFGICFASLQAETPSRRTERGLEVTENNQKSKFMSNSYKVLQEAQ